MSSNREQEMGKGKVSEGERTVEGEKVDAELERLRLENEVLREEVRVCHALITSPLTVEELRKRWEAVERRAWLKRRVYLTKKQEQELGRLDYMVGQIMHTPSLPDPAFISKQIRQMVGLARELGLEVKDREEEAAPRIMEALTSRAPIVRGEVAPEKRLSPREQIARMREQAMKLLDEGLTHREVRERVGCGRSTLTRWAALEGKQRGFTREQVERHHARILELDEEGLGCREIAAKVGLREDTVAKVLGRSKRSKRIAAAKAARAARMASTPPIPAKAPEIDPVVQDRAPEPALEFASDELLYEKVIELCKRGKSARQILEMLEVLNVDMTKINECIFRYNTAPENKDKVKYKLGRVTVTDAHRVRIEAMLRRGDRIGDIAKEVGFHRGVVYTIRERMEHKPTQAALQAKVAGRRELCLDLLAKGLNQRQIAAQLGITQGSVSKLLRKAGEQAAVPASSQAEEAPVMAQQPCPPPAAAPSAPVRQEMSGWAKRAGGLTYKTISDRVGEGR